MQLNITKGKLMELLREINKRPDITMESPIALYKTPAGEIYAYSEAGEVARIRADGLPEDTQLEPDFTH